MKTLPNAPNRRQAQKAETRALLLRVAASLFESEGFQQTTIRAVAREANVGTGTVFVHFADKGELLYAVLFEDLERVVRERLAAPPLPNLLDELNRTPRALLRLYASRPPLYRELLRQSLIAEGDWGRRFREQVERVAVRTLQALERAQKEGSIAPHINLKKAAEAHFAFYYFTLIQAAAEGFVDVAGSLSRIEGLTRQHLGLEPQRPTP